jgi:hypothetical protein
MEARRTSCRGHELRSPAPNIRTTFLELRFNRIDDVAAASGGKELEKCRERGFWSFLGKEVTAIERFAIGRI